MMIALMIIFIAMVVFSIAVNLFDGGDTYKDGKKLLEGRIQHERDTYLLRVTEDMRPWAIKTIKVVVYFWYVIVYLIVAIASGYMWVKLSKTLKLHNLIYEKKENNEQHK